MRHELLNNKSIALVALLAAVLVFGAGFLVLLTEQLFHSNNSASTQPTFSPTPVPSLPIGAPSWTPTPPPPRSDYIPQPATPTFTVQYNDDSYDIPKTVTTTIDPFNGKENQIESGGFHIDNRSISVTIKNQPFSPVTIQDGNVTSFQFVIRVKGYYSNEWQTLQSVSPSEPTILPDDNSYTTVRFSLDPSGEYFFRGIASGDKIDFQVQAKIGYGTFIPDPLRSGFYHEGRVEFTTLSESGWTATQTLTIS